MKKVFLFIALSTVFPAFADPAIAPGVNPADCNEDVLNTRTGTASLEAAWTANTLNIEWYNDGNKITPANNDANTCTYDMGITVPTNTMTKEGYTFVGWKVKSLVNILSSLTTSTQGSHYYSHGLDENGDDICSSDGVYSQDRCQWSEISDLSVDEWKTVFSYGTVKGIAICSTLGSGLFAGQKGNPTNDWPQNNATYCWCQVTGYDEGSTGTYTNGRSSKVFAQSFNSADSCKELCGGSCSYYTYKDSTFRGALYN